MALRPDMSPKEIFEEYVVAQFERVKGLVENHDAFRVSAIFAVNGEGGGAWKMQLDGGQLDVSESNMSDDAEFCIALTMDSFSLIMDNLPPEAYGDPREEAQKALKQTGGSAGLTPAKLDQLKAVNTSLALRLSEVGGGTGTFETRINFNTAPRDGQPTTIFEIKYADWREMEKGNLLPQQAFMQGKLRITGDMSLAMTLGSLLM